MLAVLALVENMGMSWLEPTKRTGALSCARQEGLETKLGKRTFRTRVIPCVSLVDIAILPGKQLHVLTSARLGDTEIGRDRQQWNRPVKSAVHQGNTGPSLVEQTIPLHVHFYAQMESMAILQGRPPYWMHARIFVLLGASGI